MALEMKGEYALRVQQRELWRLLCDPDVLAKIIPGCNTVRLVGIDCYQMGLKLQVGSVSGEYMGSVAIFDKQEPLHYVLTIEGQGSIGFMKGSAAFDLEARGESNSLLHYAGSAEVGGVVAGVGQRVLSGVAKFLAGRFFKALEKHIEEGRQKARDASAAKGDSEAKDISATTDASATKDASATTDASATMDASVTTDISAAKDAAMAKDASEAKDASITKDGSTPKDTSAA